MTTNWLVAAAREEQAARIVLEPVETLAQHKRRIKPDHACTKCGARRTFKRMWLNGKRQCRLCGAVKP